MKVSTTLAAVLLVTLPACSGLAPRKSSPSAISPDDRTLEGAATATRGVVSSTPNPLPGSPPPASDTALTGYRMEVEIASESRRIEVRQSMSYTNLTPLELDRIVLAVPPAEREEVFELDEILIEGASASALPIPDGNRLNLPLPRPLASGDTLSVELAFTLYLQPLAEGAAGEQGGLGWTERQINLHNWHPIIAPFDLEEGWLVHRPHRVGEHVVAEAADFHVSVTVDDPRWQIIGPGWTEEWGEWVRFDHGPARAFSLTLLRTADVSVSNVEGVQIKSYYYPGQRAAGEAVLDAATRALQIYSDTFGAYPHRRLILVQADFLDGLESDGLVFVGGDYYPHFDGTPRGYLIPITVHEVAHQWWYGRVGNDPALEPWLDEALATYSERLYFEARLPELVDWWWDFRVDVYSPRGNVGSSIYEFDSFRSYVNAVYLRGALFLEALRREMGDQVFFELLRGYVADQSAGIATGQDFWDAVEARGGEPEAFLEAYFREKGHGDLLGSPSPSPVGREDYGR